MRNMRYLRFSPCLLMLLTFSLATRAQNIYVSPKLLPFPNTAIGSTSAPMTVAIDNNQTGTLSISGMQVAAPFSQVNNCGSTLTPNQTCTISVTFSPTTVKYYSASLTITDSAGNSPQVISLTGNGVKSTVSYTPTVGGIYFYNQIVSTPSTPQPVTITNNGSTALTFNSITSSADYPFTTNCGNGQGGGTLAVGASCTVQVQFDPQALGKRITNLTIAESAAGSPIVVPLQGTGISGTPPAAVAVTPSAPCVLPSGTEQFAAVVTSEANTAVTWLVDNITGGNSTVGTITQSGLYTAPPYAGSHIIKAVSQASNSVSGESAIGVNTSPTFEIYPYVSSIPINGQQTFQAQQCLVPDTNVTYTVDNIAGGNATVGTINNNGAYTAPATPGKHTVRVTDSTLNKTSGAVVTAFTSITADFNSRANNTSIIPAGMFGYGRGEALRGTSDRELLTQAGLTEARLSALITLVYASQTPDWTKIDPMIEAIQSTGQHALLQLNQSPTWLQPTTGKCAGSSFAAPTNVNDWATIAASYVAHFDSKFPGVVQDYEIWNEPNATGMCATVNQMDTYMNIYATAAPLMKAQAAQDSVTIRIGGPVISGYSQLWISTLLTNASTAPYVDFVSFHLYLTGQVNIDEGMTWSDLYAITQSNTRGLAHYYKVVEPLVRAGHQPNAASTPIYVTEYNDNWAFSEDCCRNHPAYSPLWNSLGITDFLNVVYSGASAVPSRLVYFNIMGNSFCMFGEWNAKMDCNSTVKEPYPQFFAYELFASSEYLDLQAGGHMAASVSPGSTATGLQATAFYTNNADSVVVVNPTSTTYDAVTVTLTNPGLTSAAGEAYLLDSSHGRISGQSVSLKSISGGYSAEVEVSAYSTVALSVKGSSSGAAPTAVLTVTPQSGTHPLKVDIDSSQSQRGGSYIIGRTIDFGDGKWQNWAPATSHTYNKAGNYTVRLTVKNQSGQLSSATSVITVH